MDFFSDAFADSWMDPNVGGDSVVPAQVAPEFSLPPLIPRPANYRH